MKNKYSEQELKKMIFSGTSELSKEEIKNLINKELEKNPDEVNTEYIDLCFELMSICNKSESKVVPIKHRKTRKTIVVAAVIMILCVSLFSVSSIYFNIPEKIAELTDGNAELQYPPENCDTTADGYALLETDPAKELESFGITPVTFPETLVGENCEITKIENTTTDETISLDADVYFSYNGFEGNLMISRFPPCDEKTGVSTVMDVKSGEMINVNGMDVLIFEQEEGCVIKYSDGSTQDGITEYSIYLYCDFDTAKEIAETIK